MSISDPVEAKWCMDALRVQDASNTSGVAHSLAELCSQMVSAGISTAAIPEHPAVKLFVAKLADLCFLDYHYPRAAEAEAQLRISAAEREGAVVQP